MGLRYLTDLSFLGAALAVPAGLVLLGKPQVR
jgi:hypothetical protein